MGFTPLNSQKDWRLVELEGTSYGGTEHRNMEHNKQEWYVKDGFRRWGILKLEEMNQALLRNCKVTDIATTTHAGNNNL